MSVWNLDEIGKAFIQQQAYCYFMSYELNISINTFLTFCAYVYVICLYGWCGGVWVCVILCIMFSLYEHGHVISTVCVWMEKDNIVVRFLNFCFWGRFLFSFCCCVCCHHSLGNWNVRFLVFFFLCFWFHIGSTGSTEVHYYAQLLCVPWEFKL